MIKMNERRKIGLVKLGLIHNLAASRRPVVSDQWSEKLAVNHPGG
jgi:hypothetical protein